MIKFQIFALLFWVKNKKYPTLNTHLLLQKPLELLVNEKSTFCKKKTMYSSGCNIDTNISWKFDFICNKIHYYSILDNGHLLYFDFQKGSAYLYDEIHNTLFHLYRCLNYIHCTSLGHPWKSPKADSWRWTLKDENK